MSQEHVGLNIKHLRAYQGRKQEHFAKDIGVSRNMLSRYENNRSAISLVHLARIAICLKTTIEVLLALPEIL